MQRRNFIKTLWSISLGFSGLHAVASTLRDSDADLLLDTLLQDADDKLPLRLAKGLKAQVISKAGDAMQDGFRVPGRPDGMACFTGPKAQQCYLIRNHENSPHELKHSPFGPKNELLRRFNRAYAYDYGKGKAPHLGGTTTVLYDEAQAKVLHTHLSLAGTARNCAGGPTPWHSWLSCEEYVGLPNEKQEKRHGYVFEVPVRKKGLVKPKPLRAMGRFNHEAVAVDPKTGIVYLTEDRHDGLFYRFVPREKGKLQAGGRLQALCFVWKKQMDTRNWTEASLKTGIPYAVKWLNLSQVDGLKDNLRYRGRSLGAACFARGEGIWFGNGELFFACTNGGAKRQGQIFRYQPSPYEGTSREREAKHQPRLELFAEPNNARLLMYCDNLTVAPWGELIFCEDKGRSRLIGLQNGRYRILVENIGPSSEMAGVCFSPSGQTLFVNLQDRGFTLAIQGLKAP